MQDKKIFKEEEEEEDTNVGEEIEKQLYLVDIKPININDYQIEKKIRTGQFGNVFKILYKKTNETFAAKICGYSPSTKNIFINETIIQSHFSHPSILKYIGYSPIGFENSNKPTIITEYCKNGTLYQILNQTRQCHDVGGWKYKMKLINTLGIASGMMYLHSINIRCF